MEEHATVLLQMPENAERHLPRWVRLMGVTGESRTYLLKELYRRGGSELRRSALWRVDGCLRRTGDQPAAHNSERAAGGVLSPREAGAGVSFSKPVSTGRPVAVGDGGSRWTPSPRPWTLESYWNDFESLDVERRADRLARHRTQSPHVGRHQSTAQQPRSNVAIAGPQDHQHARDHCELRRPALHVELRSEPRSASAAVLALGRIPTPTSKRILQQAMVDPDDRVQANAVEAGDQGGQMGSTNC